MRNFIVFLIAGVVLGFGGYFAYRVYVVGEAPDAVLNDLRPDEEQPDYIAKGDEAYRAGKYQEAVEMYTKALAAHDTREPGAVLEEERHKDLLLEIGSCYIRLWEDGGKTDDSLRRDAKRTYQRFLDEYPARDDRIRVLRIMKKVRKPSENTTVDEAPPA